MRVSRQDAAENRERVIETASEMFRTNGYDGVGIATLMKASGLTNGAFYKQFDSKEALLAEATAHALCENVEGWRETLESDGDDPLAATARWYLSKRHLDHRGKGCAYATLAAEAPRHDESIARTFDEGIHQTLDAIVASAGTGDPGRDETTALRHLSRLVGALVLARAVGDPDFAERIMSANRAPE